MLKNAFFGKNAKNRLSDGGSAPEPLFASGGWGFRPQTTALLLPPTMTTLSNSFLALNAFYYPQKKKKFCFFQAFVPIFHFKLCSFCWQEAQKYFLSQGAG